jgi:hypothetical protein
MATATLQWFIAGSDAGKRTPTSPTISPLSRAGHYHRRSTPVVSSKALKSMRGGVQSTAARCTCLGRLDLSPQNRNPCDHQLGVAIPAD